MPRNIERDAQRMEQRKMQLLNAGFELFAEHGIESVSLQEVAKKADVPIATLYKYYQNKVNLVVSISANTWGNVWKKILEEDNKELLFSRNAYEMVEFYCDIIIDIYKKKPQILCFSSNFKTYLTREGASDEQVKEQIDTLKPISDLFHAKYEQAKENHCIRTDIPEQELFSTLALTMLGMAERYAQGLVWAKTDSEDSTKALMNIKEMLLQWLVK